MVNRWGPWRVPVVGPVEEAVTDGDAGGAVLAGAAALGCRPAGGGTAAGLGAGSPAAPPAAAAAVQTGPLGESGDTPHETQVTAARHAGSSLNARNLRLNLYSAWTLGTLAASVQPIT